MTEKTGWGFAAAAVIGAGAAAWTANRFQKHKEQSVYRLTQNGRLVETRCGPIEIAAAGEGPPVLVVHGAAGGYDQGMLVARGLTGYRVIAVSRPGYLRTPLESGRTPAEQADALAALLDALGIESAALVGISAGGLVGIHFALQYPQRCWALALVSAVNAPLPTDLNILKPLVSAFANDFLLWALIQPQLMYLAHPNLRQQVQGDPQKRGLLEELLDTTFPVSMRLPGMLNDADQVNALPELPLDEVRVPTLVIHGDADTVVPFEQGQRSAGEIPGAGFLPIPSGSHFAVLTHAERTIPAILDLLDRHAPTKQTFRVLETLKVLKERLRS